MSLPTVYFDNYNTYSDWGFFLVTKVIEPPKPKVYKVEIPGGSGDLDITESVFGGIAYNDRKITMKFRAIGPQNLWTALKTNILSAIHGRRMQMIFNDELSYYYEGRVEITNFHYNFDVAEMEVEADCNPFKFEISKLTTYPLNNIFLEVSKIIKTFFHYPIKSQSIYIICCFL